MRFQMSTPILFADDTSLIVSTPDRLQLEKDSNAVMQSLSKWFHSDLLSLNCTKNPFFTIPNKKHKYYKTLSIIICKFVIQNNQNS